MKRKTTFFEKVLLLVGVFCAILGFFLINKVFDATGRLMSYEMLTVVFLWFIVIFLIIIAAISENQKEESAQIVKELHTETRLMRQLVKDNVLEIKLLREDLSALNKIDKDLKRK